MVNPFKQPTTPKPAPASTGSFLPSDYIDNRQTSRISFIGVGLLIIVMAGVCGAFLVTTRHRSAIRAQQEQINVEYTQEAKKIEQLKRLEVQRREMMEKAEVTAALLEKVPRSMLLAELITRMPKDVTLLELELKGKRIETPVKPASGKPTPGKPAEKPAVKSLSNVVKGEGVAPPAESRRVTPPKFEFTLTLTGVASVNNDIAEYLGQLQSCSLLGSVELQYIQQTVLDEMNMRRFQIVAQIKPNADAHDLVNLNPALTAAKLNAKLGGAGSTSATEDESSKPEQGVRPTTADAQPDKGGQ